jgi:hypothetical protein
VLSPAAVEATPDLDLLVVAKPPGNEVHVQSTRFPAPRPISPQLHGTLDYSLAAILIARPLVLHFDDTTAKVVVLVIGGAVALLAVSTAWSCGIIR